MKTALKLFAALGIVAGGQAHAQELQNQSGDMVDATTDLDFSLEVDAEKSSSVVSYGGFVGNPNGNGAGSDLTWAISAEFPIGGKDNLANGETLDRLSGGPKLSLSFNFLFSGSDSFAVDTYKFGALNKEALTACLADTATDRTSPENCRTEYANPNESFVRKHLPSAELRMNRLVLGGYSTLGIEGSIGTEKFDFVTPGTLAEGNKRRVTWSTSVAYGYFGSDAVSAYKLSAEFSRSPEDLDEVVICKTVIVTPADDCVNALSRAPNLEDALVLKAEARRFFPFRNGKGGIGAALTGGYDALNDNWEIELPVYFSIPGDSPVLPGVSFGYKSKKDKFTVGLFLKTAFKF